MIYIDDAKKLVEDALDLFYPNVCPYCDRVLPLKDYVSEGDVDKFIREHPLVVVHYTEKP